MISKDEILAQFRQVGVVRGNTLFLYVKESLKLIDACERNNLAPVRIEGYIVHSDVTEVRPLIFDYVPDPGTPWTVVQPFSTRSARKWVLENADVDHAAFYILVWTEEQYQKADDRMQQKERSKKRPNDHSA